MKLNIFNGQVNIQKYLFVWSLVVDVVYNEIWLHVDKLKPVGEAFFSLISENKEVRGFGCVVCTFDRELLTSTFLIVSRERQRADDTLLSLLLLFLASVTISEKVGDRVTDILKWKLFGYLVCLLTQILN